MNSNTFSHPAILKHAYPQYLDAHLRSSVLDAFIAVFDMIRERTALYLDGSDLVGKAFSLSEPRLIVSELSTDSGKSDQKGFIQLLQGAYLSVRNPKAHSLRSDLDNVSAAQYLVFASLLARRIEAATQGNFLRFDGLYVSVGDIPTNRSYIRFYEDSEVLTVSTGSDEEDDDEEEINEIQQNMGWLTKEISVIRGYPCGVYTQSGNRIKFTVGSKVGEVEYEGEICGETLRLQIHSRINGRRGEGEFKFRSNQ